MQSGLALDPVDGRTFWAFNEYSVPGPVGIPGVDGAWATAVIKYRLDETNSLIGTSFIPTVTNQKNQLVTEANIIDFNPQSSLINWHLNK